MRFIYNVCFCVITALLMPLTMMGQTADEGEIKRLQTEMYRLFYQEDSLAFRQTVSELMDATKKSGNDELFYRAWGNNSIYESTHQRRTHALEIAREMEAYAKAHKSIFGQYTAMHVTGTVYQQMRDYENAERTFKEAIDFLHKYAPGQSAAADYIELVLLSVNGQRDAKQGMAYAEMTLKEQNAKLVTAIVFLLGALLVALLVWTIWRRVKLTRKLRYELDLKRDFVNNLAKRLRTPLNPITGFSNILASGDVELSPEEREMMNRNIQDGTKMLTGIIDNVFELSYYESRQKLDKTDTFHPNLVCQNAIDQVVDNRKKSGVEVKLVTELPDDLVITRGSAKSPGMDLAICKSVTKLLGGDIWLDESYTNGSRFVFEIPKE